MSFDAPLENSGRAATPAGSNFEPTNFHVNGAEIEQYRGIRQLPSSFPESPFETASNAPRFDTEQKRMQQKGDWTQEDRERAQRVHNEWQINHAAGDFFHGQRPPETASFRVRDAWMEVLMSHYCAGDNELTPEHLAKDWAILAQAGITKADIEKVLQAAEDAGITGRTGCLIT
jgi:hypothetical protein